MTIVVTGAAGGLGRALVTRLNAIGLMRADGDLSRIDEVRRLASRISAEHPDLAVLINNAGVSKFTHEVTPDGLETTFATNYMAPFVLTSLLLPTLRANRGMVVNITSEQHRWVRAIPWDDLQGETRFNPIEQYGLTKLYLVMFTRELARRDGDVTSICVSPGFLRTGLGREARGGFGLFLVLARPFQQKPDRGAEAVAQAMASPESGAYFRGSRLVAPGKLAQDGHAAARLWDLSSRWLEPSQGG